METDVNDKDILHIVHRGSVWDLVGAAYISVRNYAYKQRMKERVQGMTDEEALSEVDKYVTLIDTSGIGEC